LCLFQRTKFNTKTLLTFKLQKAKKIYIYIKTTAKKLHYRTITVNFVFPRFFFDI